MDLERRIRYRLYVVVGLPVVAGVLCLSGCAERPSPGPPPRLAPFESTIYQELFDAHNRERISNYRPALRPHIELVREAQAWARTMAASGRFQHSGRGAENIAAGQPDVAAVMADWMRSPGHRANILSRSYTLFGAGVARASNGSLYWCVRFE